MSLFNRVKSWFHKAEPEYQESYEGEGNQVLVEEAGAAASGEEYVANDSSEASPEAVPDYAAEIEPAPVAAPAQSQSRPVEIQLPLAPIIATLAQELRERLLVDNVGDASVFIPLPSILPQLSRGQACISFGELRHAARGAFTSAGDLDESLVNLPLSIVLPRITPDMLARKQARAQMDIPEEIVSPFAEMGRGLSIANVQRGSVATASGQAPVEAASAAPVSVRNAAVPAAVPQRSKVAPAPVAAPVAAPKKAAAAVPVAAALPRPTATPAANFQALRAGAKTSSTIAPAQPKPAAPPRPAAQPAPAAPRQPIAFSGAPPVASRPTAPAQPRPAASQPAVAAPVSRPTGAQPAAAAPARPPIAGPAPARPAGVPLSSLPGARSTAATAPQPQAFQPGAPAPSSPGRIPATGLPQLTASPAAAPASAASCTVPATGLPPHPTTAAPVSAPPPVAAPPRADEQPPLLVLMSAISEFWPDGVKEEIAALNAAGSRVGLPFSAVEAGLRRGRLNFSWQQLRSWLRPAVPREASPHDALQLELPLRTVAPIFIAQQRSAHQSQQRVAVDMAIPDLFSGSAEPQSDTKPDHAVTRPVDTNFYVWDDDVDAVAAARAEEQRPSHVSETEFLARAATPNEVVTRAAAIEGIVGALIALPDGLMVASKLPGGVNGETLAAFLPHLYGKVTQCTQELRMGELNNLKFTVGNVPWKIYRVNALYFAAFGEAGKPLPGAPLHALAMELDRKVKE